MKYYSLIAASIIALSASNASSADLWESAYIGISGGASFAADSDVTSGTSLGNGNSEFDAGFNVELNAGLRINEYVRIEGELGYLQNNYSEIVNTSIGKGKQSALYAVTSVYFDYQLTENITPFIGIGGGLASFEIGTLTEKGTTSSGKLKVKDSVTPIFKLSVGSAYKLSDRVDLTASYDFMKSADYKFSGLGGEGKTDFTSHLAQVGLRYNF
ncbi:outer membrane beta-barrel protein [Pseudovibrio sp. Tun.PSC04-5.I4]|uniref:outer membrane protein n=1 Tax=Pseudovibrio sp. Tun.PSC04-5.I4 TaxID=1798213 RepID=UPI000888F6E1|nr:outer membrane beta-barrel protein [Pseudovibrio sp. Tun.PSC04-5.I4]SDR18951.1 Opacity protein [Pseudovibrio sp. Tun.PSC04-5.I4]